MTQPNTLSPAADNSSDRHSAFILLLDAPSLAGAADTYAEFVRELEADCSSILGSAPWIRWAVLPDQASRMGRAGASLAQDALLEQGVQELLEKGITRVFFLPASFDFGMQQKEWLVASRRALLRKHPALSIHYDAMQASHPLLLQALVDGACRELAQMSLRHPGELGLLLIANGAGDPETRADSYHLMRLLWEQLGASRADVAFVRHAVLPLPEQLAACARSGLTWLCLPQFLWPQEQLQYANSIFTDCVRQFAAAGFRFGEPLAEHPNLRAWLKQRIVELYRSQRQRLASRIRSHKQSSGPSSQVYGPTQAVPLVAWQASAEQTRFGPAVVAELGPALDLRVLLDGVGFKGGRTIVKPTWHGYATGTYTDALALDALFTALPGAAVVVEAHTASKNSGGSDFDWEHEAKRHRSWIRHQEQEYLAKTGLKQTLLDHHAGFVNVTECWWDGQCADVGLVNAVLEQRGVKLHFEELSSYVPQALFDLRGASMLSYARFKGPTRLALSNLFGLLPQPLRAAWHGPNITYFARVCCDLAKLYGALFDLYAVVESLSFAVRWERRGLYRSRWGNYDLLESPRVVCLSRGLPAADVMAARLQGQQVAKSAFYDVVRAELGIDAELERMPLPARLLRLFA